MKKLTFNISLFILVILLGIVLLLLYIKPSQQLDLKADSIDINEKMMYMVTNMKTEIVLTESDIDALIKMNLNPQLDDHLIVEGANFYVEKNILHATLNVKYRDKIPAQLVATYSFDLNEAGVLSMDPISIKLKDINLPQSVLSPIQFQLYDMKNSIVKITDIENRQRDIIIKWKINLF